MLFDDFFNRIVKYRKKLNQNKEISLEVMWPSWNKRQILGGNDATDNHRPVSQVITHPCLSFPSCLREVSDIFGPSSLHSDDPGAVLSPSPASGVPPHGRMP